MEKETCIFKIQKYLEEVSNKYDCGGIWLCKKLGKRLSFISGVKPIKLFPPQMIKIRENYFLFIEDTTKIDDSEKNNIASSLVKLLINE